MDGESASFSWNGLFPEIDHTDKFDDFGLPVSPVFQVMMPQEFQDPVNRRSQGGKKTTNNGSTYTFLVHNEHTESQKANAMKRRPVKSGGQGKVSGSSRKNKSAVGESSLDRRRTQVRLAQRAYRQRKDDTVAALGKQCEDLKDTIRNLNEAFDAFYTKSCQSGIGSREPEYMYHLRQTVEYVGGLANLALEEASTGRHERNDICDRALPIRPSEERPSQERRFHQAKAPSLQPVTGNEYVALSPSWSESLTAGIPELCTPDTTGGIIQVTDPMDVLLCPSPMLDSTLLASHTNAAERASFAQRLQQDALERGFELLTNPNTPLSILKYAFEYCLPVRSREEITDRLQVLLKQSKFGVLLGHENDNIPQNTPRDAQSDLLDQIFGTRDPSGLPGSLGLISPVREPEMRLFQASQEFLSAHDVESYLKSRGIVITSTSKLLQLKIPQDLPAWQPKSYQNAILSVNKLIENVLDRAVCLCTGPGFRKVDVESALRTSIRVSA